MNSWGNDELEKRMEELLSSSVRRGSEPAGFSVKTVPRRPGFPWGRMVFLVAAACAGVFFLWQLPVVKDLGSIDYGAFFSTDGAAGFFSAISQGKAVSTAAVLTGITGGLVCLFPDLGRVLRRML